MRIAYTLVCYDAANSGVYRKILDQVTAWKASGHSVQLFVITDKESLLEWQKIDPSVVALFDAGLVRNLINRATVLRLAAESSPSIIYLRDSFPIWLRKTSLPIVLEIQSLVGQELRLRSKSRYLVFRLLARLIYSRICGAVFVTNELREKNEFKLSSSIAKITIGNGINFARITPLPERPEAKPAIFFVGTPNQPWHGISELIEFAKLNPDIRVEVVGSTGQPPTPNIRFHGILSPDEYYEIATKCIAGIGSMNLSVNMMTEASPLKVREYLALGLPVVIKFKDVDLSPSDDYVLQLPFDGRQLSDFSREVRLFLDEWSNKRVSASQVVKIDVATKEEIRLRFFEKVIAERNREIVKGS